MSVSTYARYGLLCLVAGVLFLPGCDKLLTEHVKVNADVKKDLYFKKGSWWIMRDSLSGRLDSFYVVADSDLFLEQGPVGRMDITSSITEAIGVRIDQLPVDPLMPVDSFNYGYRMGGNELQMEYTYHYDTMLQFRFNAVIGFSYLYSSKNIIVRDSTPIHINHDTIGKTDIRETHYPLADMSVNGNSFSNVIGIHYSYYLRCDTLPSAYMLNDAIYLNKDAGLIKLQLHCGQQNINRIWELVRWHVVK